jgi:prolyl oligopeptidase
MFLRRASLTLLVACAAIAHAAPANFPAQNVPETFFGTRVDDPYRALENDKDPKVAAWMKSQADYAHATIEGLKGYPALKARITELDNATAARIGTIRQRKDALFFMRRGKGDNVFKLYVKAGDGPERLLVDPDEFEKRTGKPHAINYFEPSPDSKLVAVGVSPGGNELASLYIIDAATGKEAEPPIDRARYSNPYWLPDSKAFFYSRVPKIGPNDPVSELFKNNRTYLHRLGTSADDDVLLLGPDGNPKVHMVPTEGAFIRHMAGSNYAVAVVYDGVRREIRVYSAPLAEAVKSDGAWVKVCDTSDQVTDYAVHGDNIYLLTHAKSPRFSVIRTSLAAPNVAAAEVVVPPGTEVISDVGGARDALYMEMRDGALKRLKRLRWNAKEVEDVKLPLQGAASLLSTDADLDGTVIGLAAWTRANEIYAVSQDGAVRNTGLQPLGPFDAPDDVVATEVKVPSHDGAMVPLSIIHKKGLKLDGSHPALLIGYGSYGITYDASFDPVRLAWLERGGVYAVANVRGSAAYGEDWYKAGYKATKPNTWKDFIACGEYLVRERYTSKKKLGIWGGSAGGITIGRAITERPDLFAAAVPVVGMLDFVRLQVMPIGPVNVPEFGDIHKEDEFRALFEMSAYHHVKKGTKYPAVLLQHGVNDTRVNVGQSNKMAAALMDATTSGKPILLDLEYDSGHGQGMTKSQRQKTIAHYYAFLLWQDGDPQFQPK